ncbi:hypothetical protein ACFL54_04050 [Planctomycetota bacterium]
MESDNLPIPVKPSGLSKRQKGRLWAGVLSTVFFAGVLFTTTTGWLLEEGQTTDTRIFLGMAIFGTVLFALRMGMMILGMTDDFGGDDGGADVDDFADVDMDADGDVGADVDADHGEIDHASEGFKVLSLNTISAFTMGAGWLGLAALSEWGTTQILASGLAYGFGVSMVLLITFMMKSARKLDASGTMKLEAAIAQVGSVYSRIPANREGEGQVQIEINNSERVLPAITDHDKPLNSFTKVIIVDTTKDGRLVAIPQEEE